MNIQKLYSVNNDPGRDKRDNDFYSDDLDIFGSYSLFTYLDVTFSQEGKKQFINNLLLTDSPEYQTIKKKQETVRNLCNQKNFSWNYIRKAGSIGQYRGNEKKINLDSFFRMVENLIPNKKLEIYKNTFNLIFIASLFAGLWFDAYGIPSLVILLQISLWAISIKSMSLVFNSVTIVSPELRRVGSLVLHVIKPSEKKDTRILLRKLYDSIDYLSYRETPVLRFIYNAFFLTDFKAVNRLSDWSKKYGESYRELIKKLIAIDSIIPFIHFSSCRVDASFPKLVSDASIFSAEELHHPLLPVGKSVGNPVDENQAGTVIMITGSNMSGKTTYLRSIGLNCILAMNGCAVTAKNLVISPLILNTSIRSRDSLEEGISFFYAEVIKIAKIAAKVQKYQGFHLVLIDELLKGTNSSERQSATEEILQFLKAHNSIVFVTSHDVSLADKNPSFIQKHFGEALQSDGLGFDYKIKNGVVKNTNALKIFRQKIAEEISKIQ